MLFNAVVINFPISTFFQNFAHNAIDPFPCIYKQELTLLIQMRLAMHKGMPSLQLVLQRPNTKTKDQTRINTRIQINNLHNRLTFCLVDKKAIIFTCEIIINNLTCEIISFISARNPYKAILYIIKS